MSTLEGPAVDAPAAASEPLLVGENVDPLPLAAGHRTRGRRDLLLAHRRPDAGRRRRVRVGKSVLARSIMNILPRLAVIGAGGQIRFRGRDIRPLPRSEMRKLWGQELAIVFQDPMTSLNPVMRVGDQLTEPLRVRLGLDRKRAAHRALELFRSRPRNAG